MNKDVFKDLFQYLKKYKFQSVILRNFSIIFLIFLIPFLLISFFTFCNIKNNSVNYIKETNASELNRIKLMSENIIAESNLLLNALSLDAEIVDIALKDEIYDTEVYKNLSRQLGLFSLSNKYIESIYLYFKKTDFIVTNTTSCKLGVFNDITWDNNSVMNKNIKISVRHIDFSNTYYLTIIRDINLNNQLGQVIINLDLEQFNVLFESRHKNTIYMATAANEVLYTLDTELIGKNMTEIYQFSDRFLIDGTLFDKKDEVGAVASDKYDIKYFSIVSDSYYDNLYIESIKYGLTIVILNFVLCFIISALLSVEIFTPIDSIFKMISNRPQAKKDVAKNNEINYIFYEINNMKNMNEKLKKEIDYYMAMVNETQIKALQAQIKPHFLFNTLENVIWKIRDDYKRDTEATQILIYLSQMLRYALNMNTKLVPISEEIEQLKIYIKLLQIRYVDKFDVIWNVDPNAVNYKIIKLTLQPIVENCIYHGIKPLKDKGKVKIDVLESKDHIKIVIEDFGIGMNQEQVNKIKANLENEVLINDEHIGIINTNKRLNLFFGVEYGMNIESKPNYGTKVEIIIPKIKD